MNLFFVTWWLWPLVAGIIAIKDRPSDAPSNLIVDIVNGVLRDVRFFNSPALEVNISNMPIHLVTPHAFDMVFYVKTLILANNSLFLLPNNIFSNLKNLKYLSLSGNYVTRVNNLFVGLNNLQILDISQNYIHVLFRGDLVGLPKSARILVGGNPLENISRYMFNERNIYNLTQLMEFQPTADYMYQYTDDSATIYNYLRVDIDPSFVDIYLARLCQSDGIVTSLNIHNEYEYVPDECAEQYRGENKILYLSYYNIKGFQKGWYRLQSKPIVKLDLSKNKITEVEEILNDLPANLIYVNLQGNKIRRIKKIENNHLTTLIFDNNFIEKIEDGAFEKTTLVELHLSQNKLRSLNFVFSLPNTLKLLEMKGNFITFVPNGVFNKLSYLIWLNLDGNKIETLQSNIFQGLRFLQVLKLTNNNITTIEPDAFKGLTSLKILELGNNSISFLRNNTFVKLSALTGLNLASNRIVKTDVFAELPRSVKDLRLDNNEIESIEEGTFVQAPRFRLSLSENKISRIVRGAFNLPELQKLWLNNNNLTTIGGDIYESMYRLSYLSLAANKISEIRKGDCKNLTSLNILDISGNLIEKLENGALYGLRSYEFGEVIVGGNNLKEIHGGVFNDV